MRRVLQRVVLPVDRDMDVLPLYVDPDRPQLDVDKSGAHAGPARQAPADRAQRRRSSPTRTPCWAGTATGSATNQRISFGTYFNGFAASYWRRWTVVDEVALHVTRHRCRTRR